MRRVIIYITAVIIIAFTASSCESVITFKGAEADPKIVIYSLLHPDSVITVSVAVSHAVFEERYEPEQITDAVVRLFRDGELLETLAYAPPVPSHEYYPASPYSTYLSEVNRPEYGSTYRIEVEVPGLKTASGEATLPEPVAIISIDTSSVIMEWMEWIERRLTVKIKFRDPAGEEDFYRASGTCLYGFYNGNKEEPYSPLMPVVVSEMDISYAFYSEPLIAPKQDEDIFGMYLQNSYNLFTDELISGKEYDLTMEIHFNLPDTGYYEFAHSFFRLHTISRDMYLYLQSYSAHTQTRDNFLVEPVLVYTNISNGLGVLGAMSTSVDSLKIGEYPIEGVIYEYQRDYK